jgi:hypothetical protein
LSLSQSGNNSTAASSVPLSSTQSIQQQVAAILGGLRTTAPAPLMYSLQPSLHNQPMMRGGTLIPSQQSFLQPQAPFSSASLSSSQPANAIFLQPMQLQAQQLDQLKKMQQLQQQHQQQQQQLQSKPVLMMHSNSVQQPPLIHQQYPSSTHPSLAIPNPPTLPTLNATQFPPLINNNYVISVNNPNLNPSVRQPPSSLPQVKNDPTPLSMKHEDELRQEIRRQEESKLREQQKLIQRQQFLQHTHHENLFAKQQQEARVANSTLPPSSLYQQVQQQQQANERLKPIQPLQSPITSQQAQQHSYLPPHGVTSSIQCVTQSQPQPQPRLNSQSTHSPMIAQLTSSTQSTFPGQLYAMPSTLLSPNQATTNASQLLPTRPPTTSLASGTAPSSSACDVDALLLRASQFL